MNHPLMIRPREISKPKPVGQLAQFVDRVVGTFSPTKGLQRAKDRAILQQYSWEAARPGTYRQQALLNDNASTETSTLNYERIRIIWDARDLECNFGFVVKILNTMEDYVLGDFRIKSKATNPDDRKAMEEYYEMWGQNCDPSGKENSKDQDRLALRSTVRDGDILGVFEENEVEIPGFDKPFPMLQRRLIEADRIGYPYEGSLGDGYLNGVIYDKDTGAVTGYRVYRREALANTYTNPCDVPAEQCLYLAFPKRVDSLRSASEFASALPTMRDIKEIIENERMAVKWCSAQSGVIKTMTGEGLGDTNLFPDFFEQKAGVPPNKSMLTDVAPGKQTYLAPGEDYQAFDYNRPSPTFNGLIQALHRDCCHSVSIPYGFLYEPTTNGTAMRLESMQAKRTFSRWQRLMRDKWISPTWNRVIMHGVANGLLQLTPQGMQEISLMKIIWPAHPTVDGGNDSQSNINEYNNNLRSGESISEERGDDWEEMNNQLAYEDKLKRDKLGLAEAVINNFGPKGIDGLLTLMTSVSNGTIPPENGRDMLMGLFGLDDEEALKIIPLDFKIQPPPLPPPRGGGGGGQPGKPAPAQPPPSTLEPDNGGLDQATPGEGGTVEKTAQKFSITRKRRIKLKV